MGIANLLEEAVAFKKSDESADLVQDENTESTEQSDSSELEEGKGSVIDQMREIVKEKQYRKIKGHTVDLFTASHVVQVYDALGPANQKKLESLPLPKMVDLVWKLVKKVS